MPKSNQVTGDVADQRPIQPNLRQYPKKDMAVTFSYSPLEY